MSYDVKPALSESVAISNRSRGGTNWSAEDIRTLCDLWETKSCQEISRALQRRYTKSAVAGKVRRLGLNRKPGGLVARIGLQPGTPAKPIEDIAAVRADILAGVSMRDIRDKHGCSWAAIATQRAQMGFARHAIIRNVNRLPRSTEPKKATPVVLDVPVERWLPLDGSTPQDQPKANECMWPIDKPSGKGFLFCSLPVLTGDTIPAPHSYCGVHRCMSYNGAPKGNSGWWARRAA